MLEFLLALVIGVIAYAAGYYHGVLEGRHRERFKIPIHWLKG